MKVLPSENRRGARVATDPLKSSELRPSLQAIIPTTNIKLTYPSQNTANKSPEDTHTHCASQHLGTLQKSANRV